MKRHPIWIIIFTILIDTLGIGILGPILPQLLGNPASPHYLLGKDAAVGSGYIMFGFLVAVFPIMQFFATPILGQLSDRYGRKPVMMIPWLLLFALVIPAFVLITRLGTPAALLGAAAVLAILRSLGTAPIIAALTEGLPARVRSGSLALTYALAVATFGGTAQFMVAWLIAATGSPLAPAWYVMTALGCGLIAMALMHETAPVRAMPAGLIPAAG